MCPMSKFYSTYQELIKHSLYASVGHSILQVTCDISIAFEFIGFVLKNLSMRQTSPRKALLFFQCLITSKWQRGSGIYIFSFLVTYTYPTIIMKKSNTMVYFHIHLCKRHINLHNLYPLTLTGIILHPNSSLLKMFSSTALFHFKPGLFVHLEMPPTI